MRKVVFASLAVVLMMVSMSCTDNSVEHETPVIENLDEQTKDAQTASGHDEEPDH